MVMPAPGQIARRILGRYFKPLGDVYRRVFVNLDKIVDFFDHALPHNAKILDIGGGDGALVDRLLDRRPDLKITMCDLSPSIGAFLSAANRSRVNMYPATEFTNLAGPYDVVTISDVIHHVPVDQRDGFFRSLADSCKGWGCRRLIFKDIEPRGWRAILSVIADRYITGDRHVVLFPRSEFGEMVRKYFPAAKRLSTMPDRPNYCEVLSW